MRVLNIMFDLLNRGTADACYEISSLLCVPFVSQVVFKIVSDIVLK